MSGLLTRVASRLTRHRVPVYCRHMTGRILGYTFYNPDKIFLRWCPCIRRLRPDCVTIFAHELIHIQHKRWPHWKVYKWDNWYGRVVVAPAIRREVNRARYLQAGR